MSGSVTLLMAIHCHQPVGNFGFVFEEAYAKAYEPFLRVLERHPAVRLALHYSGSLLDWLSANRPDFLARVRALVARGQVELLASGYYEPILPLLSEEDRQGQLAAMQEALRRRFRTSASGLWLTERVWEPQLPATLARAGIRYTMIDTNQFMLAKPWLPASLQVHDDAFWDVLGCYVTDDAGASVVVFPASKRLRYWMPFQPVERTLEFFQRLRREEDVAITFADDGEKFGLWPKTHHWVYEEGWLDRLFTALEREGAWLRTATFREYLERSRPNGGVYLPSGSYEEMLEWSGGHFRNFFTKYPEANAMYQKMLRVSQALRSCPVNRVPRTGKETGVTVNGKRYTVNEALKLATYELYAGQCNCAYWHGVFGGLYLAHLRRAVYAHLIAAEELANRLKKTAVSMAAEDADGDGLDEVRLTTPVMGLVVDPADGGTITEWDLYRPRINLLDTLSRRREPYHQKLTATREPAAVPAGAAPPSIHDVLGVKEDNLTSHLVYDDHRRSAFLDYAFQSMPSLQEVVRATWGERRLWSPGSYQWDGKTRQARRPAHLEARMTRSLPEGVIRKRIRVSTTRQVVDCLYELDGPCAPVVGLEFNLSLRDERHLAAARHHGVAAAFEVAEPAVGVRLAMAVDPPAELLSFPVETVSESEGGLERTYQGLCLVCLWTLSGARKWAARVRWTAQAP